MKTKPSKTEIVYLGQPATTPPEDLDPKDLSRVNQRIAEIDRLLQETKGDSTRTEDRKSWSEEKSKLESSLAAAIREQKNAERTRRNFAGLESEFHSVVAVKFPDALAELENEALARFDERAARSAEVRREKKARLDGYLSKLPMIDRRSIGQRIHALSLLLGACTDPAAKIELQRESNAISAWLHSDGGKLALAK